jgi:DNA polymerase-1
VNTKKTKKERLVLLDAHAILHRAYHALPDFSSPTGEPTGALYGVVSMLLKIVEDFRPDHIVACFDLPDPTYRHTAFEGYKATRSKTDDDLVMQINRSRDIFAVFGIPIYEHSGFEADDMLGTIAHQAKENKDLEIIIASGDMDTLQCVDGSRVRVYTLKKGIKDTILYDEATVKERFGFPPKLVPDYKGLRGDTSDNIPGIVGIGEKTATDLIVKFGGLEKIYKTLHKGEEAFLEAGIKPRIIKLLKEGEEEAHFSKMLATIRIDAPITFSLPNKNWEEAINIKAVTTLFTELGFRSFGSRLENSLNVSIGVTEAPAGDLDPKLLNEAAIMIWLLESERTNSSVVDVIEYGKTYFNTGDLVEIHKSLKAKIDTIPTIKRVYEDIELPLLPVVEHVNNTGITLDVPYLTKLSLEMHTELTSLTKKIYALAGMEFNINSPKQLGDVLFDGLGLKPKNQKKTAGGQRSTKESELEKLIEEHEIIPTILRYRELQKLVSTYTDTLPKLVKETGRIHTTFLQTGTTTGRMGSKDPNLQNIPVRTKESVAIRRAFVASPGYVMVGIDYSQIELRIAAILSKDEKMIEIFSKGEDVHTGVAVRVFGVAPEEVTSEMRRKAKVINFGILYGMGVNALRTNLGPETSREEAQSFLNAYFNTFTRLSEYLEETKTLARLQGYTETLFGRQRHFPGIRSSAPFIKAAAERMAINAPIQGTAADVMRLAMINVFDYLKTNNLLDGVHILLQVHDELVFEIKKEILDEVVPNLVKAMEGVLKDFDTYKVPLVVDVAKGPNWADME